MPTLICLYKHIYNNIDVYSAVSVWTISQVKGILADKLRNANDVQ